MQNVNDWIWDNIALVILLNIILGGLFVFIVVRHVYKLIKKQHISPVEWAVLTVTLAAGIIIYILTGMNNSPVSL